MALTDNESLLQNKFTFFISKQFIKTPYSPFSWMQINCLRATEPPQGGSLLFITKFPVHPGTHFIDLRRMKG